MRSLFRVLFFFSLFPFFIGLILLVVMASAGAAGLAIGLALMLPLAIVLLLKRVASGRYKQGFENTIASCGGAKFADFADLTGIAITNNGKIVLCNLANVRAYPLEDVRSYKWATFEPGIGGRKHIATLAQEMRQQDDGTGLFLSVKDIENPSWQIRFKKKPQIDKWFEILNQVFGN
ncbi:hypothetical protein CAL29_06425 [Bordetella genomosp. 10]|uniref:DUF4755 domain-containing protein n=1 Tax=Bordetella genomosp. 10 TaxID=1416804 RepID=A0A261SKN8_9BORD|nr:DUF4755 domain-containing protein [Bordetella genomosp. 10]OZI37989.1 hypothetical protein CAL29_06425 [Bordetella genomosp. 10]